ncbi:MAG: helix-turn-helix transcriptional regulator [Aminipila sp.]
MNRIDRVSAILIQLQSKRIVSAKEIAERFNISTRTVYRDIRTLEEAGIPIGNELGKGYFLVEGFHLPPVMFTINEVGALITAGKVLSGFGDSSFLKNFDSAMDKIKSILKQGDKQYAEEIDKRTMEVTHSRHNSFLLDNVIGTIQNAICTKKAISIQYHAYGRQKPDYRIVEPITLGFYEYNWYLIAYCHLREEYRNFRLDRIKDIQIEENYICKENDSTLEKILKEMFSYKKMQRVVLRVDKGDIHNAIKSRYYLGVLEEKDVGSKVDIVLQTDSLEVLGKQLLDFNSEIEIVEPVELKGIIAKHYMQMKELFP